MKSQVLGLHHVTAIASDPQRNLDFYAGVLGLRLVKRTVNFDDPGTYHFYFGDEVGTPGSIMTFFPWPGARPGRVGAGQVAVTSLAVLPASIGFWIERLIRHDVRYEGPAARGLGTVAERVLSFRDPDGLMLEIVGHPGAATRPAWTGARGIPPEHAIHGLLGVTLWVEHADRTERVLADTLGYRLAGGEGTTTRYETGRGGPGTFVDVREVGGFTRGTSGAGTVHHVAFAVPDDAAELEVRAHVQEAQLHPTPVIDREYFHSVYFREPSGILYELATNAPGFTVDEPLGRLGDALKLPSRYESQRTAIEAALPEIHLPGTSPVA